MCHNRLFIAAAGSGKTSLIINEVMENVSAKILITTFTIANENSLRNRVSQAYGGAIPANVTIQTWFSFLIEHGIRPYRFWEKRVNGMRLVSQQSAFRCFLNGRKRAYWGEEKDFVRHYFNSSMDVYSDKLSKLVFKCNEKSEGRVIKRLEAIFQYIYIDEIQDMAGWDLELVKLFMRSSMNLTMVGDPRQTVYLTHHERKYKKYAHGKICNFFENECKKIPYEINETLLLKSYRNSAAICKLSSRLFPDLSECQSALNALTKHMGVFFVKKRDVSLYYESVNPMQLRLRKDSKICVNGPVLNFGESKGLEYDHVLIYPTDDMLKWICGQNVNLKEETRARLYVALTRAFFSVGIVVDDDFDKNIDNITTWSAS